MKRVVVQYVAAAVLAAMGCGSRDDGRAASETASSHSGAKAEDDAARQLAHGDAFEQEGNFAEARRCYDAVIAARPQSAVGYSRRAAVLARMYRFDEALADYGRAIELDRGNASLRLSRALTLQHMGRLDEALRDANEAVRLDTNSFGGYSFRANLHLARQDFRQALADSDEAIRRNADAFAAHHNRGLALAGLGRWADAIASYDRALALNKDFADAHVSRGTAHWRSGDLRAARADFDQAIQLAPGLLAAYENRASIRALQGDWNGVVSDATEALTRLQQAVDRGGGRVQAGERTEKVLLKRSAAYLQLRQFDQAIADATAALRHAPWSRQALLLRAAAYDAQGKHTLAEEDRQRAAASKR